MKSASKSFILLLCITVCVSMKNTGVRIRSRSEWGAREPKGRNAMSVPVDSVVIHHSYLPAACHTETECAAAMRSMQNYHMDDRGWDDIGYSFALGGQDVWEARGWTTVGAHCPAYNNRSIGIVFIGDFTDKIPDPELVKLCRQLIAMGVKEGFIDADYQLLGHRQSRDTECPGQALYELIQTWTHWTSNPH